MTTTIDTLISQLAAKENSLISYEGEDKVITLIQKGEELDAQGKVRVAFGTGYASLDKLTNGPVGGDLNVIAGLPGEGKSLFAQSLTRNFERLGVASLWLSYEMGFHELIIRFPTRPLLTYVPRQMTKNNTNWISDRCEEAKLKYPEVKVVFIDHLHYLLDEFHAKGNTAMEIGFLVRRLKRMAVALDMVVFLLCHTTKVLDNAAPGMGHIRDSGLIAGEADAIFMISRPSQAEIIKHPEREFQSNVKVEKHRRTGVRGKSITLTKVAGWLEEEV